MTIPIEYSIGNGWRLCVEFKYGCYEDKKIYTLSIGIKINDLKRRI
jgi:hypothetical protein